MNTEMSEPELPFADAVHTQLDAGDHVATFFVVGQFINLILFRASPTLPIVVGGLFIVSGGAIITLWQR